MKLIILDRDGVINEDSDDYIKSVDEWIPLPRSIEAIQRLKTAGFWVTIATNQSGLSRGYYDEQTLAAMHQKMADLLAPACIDTIEYCPHQNHHECTCRKPKAGMLQALLERFNVPANEALMVGDSLRDWQAAHTLNMPYAQVRTGKGERTLAQGKLPSNIPIYNDLYDVVDHILLGA